MKTQAPTGEAIDLSLFQATIAALDKEQAAKNAKKNTAQSKLGDVEADARAGVRSFKLSDLLPPWDWSQFESFQQVFSRLKTAREDEVQKAQAAVSQVGSLKGSFFALLQDLNQINKALDPRSTNFVEAKVETAARLKTLEDLGKLKQAIVAAGDCEATANFPMAQLEALERRLKTEVDRMALEHGTGVYPEHKLALDKALSKDGLALLDALRKAAASASSDSPDPAVTETIKRNLPPEQHGLSAWVGGQLAIGPEYDAWILGQAQNAKKPFSASELYDLLTANAGGGPLRGDFFYAVAREHMPELGVSRPPRPLSWHNAVKDPSLYQRMVAMGLAGVPMSKMEQAVIAACRANDDLPISSDRMYAVLRELAPGDGRWQQHLATLAIQFGVDPQIPMPAAYTSALNKLATVVKDKLDPALAQELIRQIQAAGPPLKQQFEALRLELANSAASGTFSQDQFSGRIRGLVEAVDGALQKLGVQIEDWKRQAGGETKSIQYDLNIESEKAREVLIELQMAATHVDSKQRSKEIPPLELLALVEQRLKYLEEEGSWLVGHRENDLARDLGAAQSALSSVKEMLAGELAEVRFRFKNGGGSPIVTDTPSPKSGTRSEVEARLDEILRGPFQLRYAQAFSGASETIVPPNYDGPQAVLDAFHAGCSGMMGRCFAGELQLGGQKAYAVFSNDVSSPGWRMSLFDKSGSPLDAGQVEFDAQRRPFASWNAA